MYNHILTFKEEMIQPQSIPRCMGSQIGKEKLLEN